MAISKKHVVLKQLLPSEWKEKPIVLIYKNSWHLVYKKKS